MFARILKSGSYKDVLGYVTRQFHDPKKVEPDSWHIIDSNGCVTHDFHKMVQGFSAIGGYNASKEDPAGHIAISFDKADEPRLTDDLMVKLAQEYMKSMKIADTQYLIVRHLDTAHPHFHIVYNRINMSGKAVNERHNFRWSDKVVKKIKNKYDLTYSPLKEKYEDKLPVFEAKIKAAIYGCTSWDEFSRRLRCAGIDVIFHDDRNTGKHIGVKFSDGDITVNGSKVDRKFTFRRLDNLFQLHAKNQAQTSPLSAPKVTVVSPQPTSPSLAGTIAESTADALGGLFQVGSGYNPEEEAFEREMKRRKKKRTYKPRF